MSSTYTTVQGDMWDAIAYKTLGSVAHTDALMRANQGELSHYLFPAGVVLILPELKRSVLESLPPWKKVQP